MKNNEFDRRYIDLHTHTTASDGSMTPAELVRHAFCSGLAAVAITDHDTVDGVGEALAEGEKLGIEVIGGVEISVSVTGWGIFRDMQMPKESAGTVPVEPEMHLLGYFFNGGYKLMQKTLEKLRKNREKRNPKIVNKLRELGFDITMEEVEKKAKGGIAGRPHIAEILVEKGYVASIGEAFEKYLAAGRPAYFKKDKLTPEEGIAAISHSGGVPVLAHPIYLNPAGEQLDRLVADLARCGLKGIEAYYTENTDEQTAQFLTLADRYGLAPTGGSDFHGSFKPDIAIGSGRGSLKVPYSLLSGLKSLSQNEQKAGL